MNAKTVPANAHPAKEPLPSETDAVDLPSPARKPKPAAAKPAAKTAKPAPAAAAVAAATPKTAVAGKPSKEDKLSKEDKPRKIKMVRDSFTMPENEYAQFAELKKRCLQAGLHAKKSELLRAGLMALSKLADADLLAAVKQVEVLKTGRPTKQK